MAGSAAELLSPVMRIIESLQPTSILDVGVGFGKWGFLARAYLDVRQGRFSRHEWQTFLAGVEIWPSYVTDLTRIIYDMIYDGDIAELAERTEIAAFDLILAVDVMEHLEKERALATMERLAARAKWLLVTLPLGEGWLGNAIVDGNPYEKHLSCWNANEIFERFDVRFFDTVLPPRGYIAIFLIAGTRKENGHET